MLIYMSGAVCGLIGAINMWFDMSICSCGLILELITNISLKRYYKLYCTNLLLNYI